VYLGLAPASFSRQQVLNGMFSDRLMQKIEEDEVQVLYNKQLSSYGLGSSPLSGTESAGSNISAIEEKDFIDLIKYRFVLGLDHAFDYASLAKDSPLLNQPTNEVDGHQDLFDRYFSEDANLPSLEYQTARFNEDRSNLELDDDLGWY
jgi:hypothetical protein